MPMLIIFVKISLLFEWKTVVRSVLRYYSGVVSIKMDEYNFICVGSTPTIALENKILSNLVYLQLFHQSLALKTISIIGTRFILF